MMNVMTPVSLPEKTKATSIEAVRFKDGMIVTANDLDAAMRYPVSMFQTLVRSYFGCGVVCGLELRADPKATEHVDPCDPSPTHVVCISGGVALDCYGFPLELCAPVKIDLSPDPCACDEPEEKVVCIAIRRMTSDEAPSDPCGCDTDDSRFQCTRVRDHVMIKAFLPGDLDDLAGCVCARPDPADGDTDCCAPEKGKDQTGSRVDDIPDYGRAERLCECLTTCPKCDCCGDSWVLLGCINLTKDGIRTIDMDRRKYVKPTECLCTVSPELKSMQEEMVKLHRKVEQLSVRDKAKTDNTGGAAAKRKKPSSKGSTSKDY